MWGGKKARAERSATRYSSSSHSGYSSSSSSSSHSYEGLEDSYKIQNYIESNFREYGMYVSSCSVYHDHGGYMTIYITVKINPEKTNKRSNDIMKVIESILRNSNVARKYTCSIKLETERW